MTAIEWTEKTWNPTGGCTIVSPGCKNCYAMKEAARGYLRDHPKYAGTTKVVNDKPVWTGTVRIGDDKAFSEPLRRKTPTVWFVNSMSDLFHEGIPDAVIDRVFAVMALCPQHTFQVLTKRADRMRAYMHALTASRLDGAMAGLPPCPSVPLQWPLPNVWLGVSVEDQVRADARIPALLDTPAAVRFISAEPLLGSIDLAKAKVAENEWDEILRLDWVIVGGESGPGARPMHPEWARSIRDQCNAADVPFFFKQHGEHVFLSERAVTMDLPKGEADAFLKPYTHRGSPPGDDIIYRVGKKRAGRLLDGVLHDAMPGEVPA